MLIEISGVTNGTGPYDVYLCDITLTYCFLISGSTTIPPSVYFELPQTFTNPLPPPTTITFGDVSSLVIKIVDLGSGCEKFIPYYCSPPTPTPTITPSPTTTPSNCLCNRLDNPTSEPLTFTYYDCENTLIYDSVPGYTSIFVCGTSVSPNEGLILSVLGLCVDSSCPNEYLTPTPTPTITLTPTTTVTQTPTPTIADMGNKIFQIGSTFIFMNGDIYIFESQ